MKNDYYDMMNDDSNYFIVSFFDNEIDLLYDIKVEIQDLTLARLAGKTVPEFDIMSFLTGLVTRAKYLHNRVPAIYVLITDKDVNDSDLQKLSDKDHQAFKQMVRERGRRFYDAKDRSQYDKLAFMFPQKI